MHNHVVQMAHSEVAIDFDADAKAARQTREAILRKIAERNLMVAGAHLPSPGLGFIRMEKNGKSYRRIPVQYRPFDRN